MPRKCIHLFFTAAIALVSAVANTSAQAWSWNRGQPYRTRPMVTPANQGWVAQAPSRRAIQKVNAIKGSTIPNVKPMQRSPGGDADLRIRSGAAPTITQTARPGHPASRTAWGSQSPAQNTAPGGYPTSIKVKRNAGSANAAPPSFVFPNAQYGVAKPSGR